MTDFIFPEKIAILIGQLDLVLSLIRKYVAFQHEDTKGTWQMDWHVYGKDTVTKDGKPGEIFIIGEALAPTQELANSLVSTARVATVHVPYPGMKATAGSFAYGLGGKIEIPLGPCASFSIYHLVDLDNGEERLALDQSSNGLYRQEVSTIGKGAAASSCMLTSSSSAVPAEGIPQPLKSKYNFSPQDAVVDDETTPTTLGALASVLRSKNSGPFELTIDIMFKTEDQYRLIKEAGFLTAANFAKLYEIEEEDIVWSGFYDQALAWKGTIPRLFRAKVQGNGGFMENDVHGSQKYSRFFDMALPGDLVDKLDVLRRKGDGVVCV
jgi:hypothetical protein